MNIDSDKLLEWFRDYIRHAAADTYAVSDHQRELLDIVFEELQDAIHSGELAAKAVYARAPDICRKYLTPGKLYAVSNDDGRWFEVEDDEGGICSCEWVNRQGVDGGDWERVEK